MAAALKDIYTAPTVEAAETALLAFADSPLGKRYPAAVAVWERAWDRCTPFLAFPPNLSAYKGRKIRAWAARNKVELCFTPTHASWANPIEAQFDPLRTFVIAGSNHPALTRRPHTYLRWRNTNAPRHTGRPTPRTRTHPHPHPHRTPTAMGPTRHPAA